MGQVVEQLAWTVGSETGDVVAWAECASSALEHDNAHFGVGSRHMNGLANLVRHGVRPGIELPGPIERDRRNTCAYGKPLN
jgi:hypothetical protein